MSRNTNALFWIICGAIFVVTVYLVINTKIPTTISEIFTQQKTTVQKADNGATPATATLKTSESDDKSFTVTYSLSNNATRYRCNYGEEKGNLDDTGIVYVDNKKVTCKANNLKSGTKYYFQLISINNNVQTKSAISSVTTK